MTLPAGGQLGPYQILSPVGAGGQGEVYRAKDTRLDRVVAIKVLASQRSADPELRQRFEREARAVSSLNHPHICTLHDVGEQAVHRERGDDDPPVAADDHALLVFRPEQVAHAAPISTLVVRAEPDWPAWQPL